jgi:hypothetical protein
MTNYYIVAEISVHNKYSNGTNVEKIISTYVESRLRKICKDVRILGVLEVKAPIPITYNNGEI